MSNLQMLSDLNDLKLLRNLYSSKSLKTIHGYYTLNNFIKWFEINPQIDHVKVYVLNNWTESGVFIIEDRYQLFINSLTSNDKDVAVALKLFDWSRNYKITSLPASLIAIVVETLRQLNLNLRVVNLKTYQNNAEQILKAEISCPESLDLRPLTISDAKTIAELWYSQQDGSLEFIKSLIAYNISMCLYIKHSNELIAWCTRCQCGFLGTLHVIESYRGQGLSAILITDISLKVVEAGEDVRVMIHENNAISQNLFTKLGFKFIENIFIVHTTNYCETIFN